MKVYRCNICGKIVLVLEDTASELFCDGQPMELLNPNTVDAAAEKHVPVISQTDEGYLVKVGSVEHPMTNEHYIQLVILVADEVASIKWLNPTDKPEHLFEVAPAGKVEAFALCNLHGLWKS